MGNQQNTGFKGKGNTLGTASSSHPDQLRRQRQQEQQQRSHNTRVNNNRVRRDPKAQAEARAAALEAAENRANKFDNLVNKKKKERKLKQIEKFKANFNNGGTLNLQGGTAKASAQKGFQNTTTTPSSNQSNVNFGGFDPTKTVMSSSATGIAANTGMATNGSSRMNDYNNNNNIPTFGGSTSSMFSSTLANHHAPVDQQQLEQVLKLTQTSSVKKRNETNSKILQQGATKSTLNNGNVSDDSTPGQMQSSIIFSEAEARGSDLGMALALLSSAKDKPKAMKCAETIVKILKNIISNPKEEKFQKLMLKGKTVTEKILMIPGGSDILVAIGFTLTSDRLGIVLKYDNIDDMRLATFYSIIETGNKFIEDTGNDLRCERLDAVVTRDKQKYGTKSNTS